MMTIDEAKHAVKNRSRVIYKDTEWIANGIITLYESKGIFCGWKNSLDLIPINGSYSRTQALVRECTLCKSEDAV